MGEQLGIYPTGANGRPYGDVTVIDKVTSLATNVFRNNTEILTERQLSDKLINEMQADGYSLSYYDSNIFYGSIQTIIKDKEKGISGGADYRRRGEYKVKY